MLSLSCVEKQIINWLSYCGVFRVWYSLFFVLFSENSKSVFCVTLENEKKKIVEVREQIKFGFVSYQIRHTEMYLAILASVLFLFFKFNFPKHLLAKGQPFEFQIFYL